MVVESFGSWSEKQLWISERYGRTRPTGLLTDTQAEMNSNGAERYAHALPGPDDGVTHLADPVGVFVGA